MDKLVADSDPVQSSGEAAAACGFESPGFFTRKFKEIMG